MAGVGTSADPKASSDHETPNELNAPFSLVVDPEGVPVSLCSSSDWEVVIMPDTTFFGITLVACATHDGVAVPGARTRGHAHHQTKCPGGQMGRQTMIGQVRKLDLFLVP